MRDATGTAALVATCGVAQGGVAGCARTGATAVALAAIAAAAQQHLRSAARTQEQAGGMVDQLPGSLGNTPEDAAGRNAGAVTL